MCRIALIVLYTIFITLISEHEVISQPLEGGEYLSESCTTKHILNIYFK